MNPFSVANVKTIYLNFEHLSMKGPNRQAFVNRITEVVREKFSGVNVNIATEKPNFGQVKEVFVHNSDKLDKAMWGKEPGDVGEAVYSQAKAEVNLNELVEAGVTSPESIADSAGTVAAHEAGHLLLPSGHSVDGNNIMSEGSSGYFESLNADGGALQNFSETQKAMMNIGIEDKSGVVDQIYGDGNNMLSDYEGSITENTGSVFGVSSGGVGSEAGVQALSGDVFPTDGVMEIGALGVAGAESWGDFDPESISSIEGLGDVDVDIEGFGEMLNIEMLSEVDLDSLSEATGGVFDAVGDIFGDVFDFLGDLV
jgi:hypothetical protein